MIDALAAVDAIRTVCRCARHRCVCWRPNGLLHCPAHNDRLPSMKVAAPQGRVLVRDFGGCTQEAVIDALRRRGVWPHARPSPSAPFRPPLEQARRDLVRDLRRQRQRLAPYDDLVADAEVLRYMFRVVAQARALVTALGPDDPHAWDLAKRAADLEREAWCWELVA